MSKAAAKKQKKSLDLPIGKSSVPQSKEADLSHLRLPMDTSVFGLKDVLTLFDTATKEVQNYLTYECDIMYECRQCRTIFRSLANFILHKRKFCRDRYRSSNDNESTRPNIFQNNGYTFIEEDLKHSNSIIENDPEVDEEGKSKKTLVPIIERLLSRHSNMQFVEEIKNRDLSEETDQRTDEKTDAILLEKIESSDSAVFQSKLFQTGINNAKNMDHVKSEVMEIHSILNENEAVVGPDGKVLSNVRPLDDRPITNKTKRLICTECDLKFSTKKTLTFHVKYKHNSTKMLYPCPCCKETFANAWCVYRHLYKIHCKTTTQVRRYRTQICNGAIPAEQLKSHKRPVSEISKNNNAENEWMDNMESDNALQMCGGCGKRFDRKAALTSHIATCSKRIAVCNSIKDIGSKKKDKEAKNKASEKQVGARKRKPHRLRKYQKKDPDTEPEIKEEPIECNINEEPAILEETLPDEKPNVAEETSNIQEASNIEETNEAEKEKPMDETGIDVKIKEKMDKREDTESDYEQMDDVEGLDPLSVLDIIGVSSTPTHSEDSSRNNSNNNEIEICILKDSSGRSDDLKLHSDSDQIFEKSEASPIVIEETIQYDKERGMNVLVLTPKMNEEFDDSQELVRGFSTDDLHNYAKTAIEDTLQQLEYAKRKPTKSLFNRVKFRKIQNDSIVKDETLLTKARPYIENLTCVPCNEDFSTLTHLLWHMAEHFSWYRYQCYQCPFMSTNRHDCEVHVKKKHVGAQKQPFNSLMDVLPIPSWKTVSLCTNFQPVLNKTNYVNNEQDEEVLKMNEEEVPMNLIDLVPENSRPVRRRVKSFKAMQDFEYDLKNIFRSRPQNKTV